MAAIDPTEAPEADEDGNVPAVPRATLKIIKTRMGGDDDEDSYLDRLASGDYSDEEESDDDDEPNGGPSDKSKSKKAQAEAAIKKLIEAAQKGEVSEDDEEMEDAPNGKSKKGKAKAGSDDEEESDEEDEDEEDLDDLEAFVVCTLDTERVSIPLPLRSTGGHDS
jgi:FK506-binding nuclear protein